MNRAFYLLLATLVIVIILLFDLVVGYFFLPESFKQSAAINTLHSYYNHGFLPHAAATKKYGAYSYKAYTNSLGMLDKTTRTVTNDGRKKIVFLGDSFVEGVGLPYTQTFPYFLEQKIDSNTTDILNAGVASFSPKLYYLRLKYLIEHQNIMPHEVFCFIDVSDYGDELVYVVFTPSANNSLNKIKSFLRGNSVIYNLYHWAAQKIFYSKCTNYNEGVEAALYWRSVSSNYLKKYPNFLDIRYRWLYMNQQDKNLVHSKNLAESYMDLLYELCLKNNIMLHIVVYPPSQLLNTNANVKFTAHKFFEEYCINKNIQYLNLFPLFVTKDSYQNKLNKEKYYIHNDSHWNENGHKLVAKKLLAYIKNS
jgi:lysophospholipase L1-like esterase